MWDGGTLLCLWYADSVSVYNYTIFMHLVCLLSLPLPSLHLSDFLGNLFGFTCCILNMPNKEVSASYWHPGEDC